jgi:hypothetical protein
MNLISIVLAVFLVQGVPSARVRHIDGCYPITADDLNEESAPKFDQFPAQKEVTKDWIPANTAGNPQAQRFRTVLKRGTTTDGPNFAGFYSVVGWGCGTSCVSFAIVNRKSGQVIFPDGIDSVSGGHLDADDFLPNAKTRFWGLRYRLDSRMLMLVGTINEDEKQEGAFYYVLENDHLRPIFSMRIEKRRCH